MRISYKNLITAVLVWAYLIMPTLLPWPWLSAFLIIFLIRFFSEYFFKDLYFDFEFNRDWFFSFLGFVIVGGAFSFQWLNLPLGSDEPHHAERALFPLKAVFDWVSRIVQPMPFESFRGNFWSLVDIRALSAVDLWPVLFLSYILVVVGLLKAWIYLNRNQSQTRKWIHDLVFLGAFAGLGWFLQGWPDNHPPLRTFFPFLSSGILGLNYFAFRFSGILACALFYSFFVQFLAKSYGWQASRVFAALIFLSPLVMFNSLLLESSIYGFMGWALILIFLVRAVEEERASDLKLAALLLPVVVLFRQPAILLALPIAYVYLVYFVKRISFPWTWGLVAAGICAPYLWSLHQMGNGAAAQAFGYSQIVSIVTQGKPIMSIYNSLGFVWLSFFVFILLVAIANFRRTYWFLLNWVVLFFAYHLIINDGAWGIARYQMEYLMGPFAALMYWMYRIYRPAIVPMAVVTFLLALNSHQYIQSIPLDTLPKDYQALRISNTTFLPEDQAIRYLKRQGADYNFAFIGGTLPTYESMLWFQGYNLWSSRQWLHQAYEFQMIIEQADSWEQIRDYIKSRGIKYFLVIENMERDLISRSSKVKKLIYELKLGQTGPLKISLERSFSHDFGGLLDLYRIE